MNKQQRIRGPRILAQLEQQLVETTYTELENKTKSFEPGSKKRQYAVNAIQVKQLKLIPYHNTGQLEVSGITTSDAKTYNTTIMFEGVEYQETDEASNVSFVGSDGDEHHILPLALSKLNVKVSCECLDFYWRFASFNAKDGSLHGEVPSPYTKKTERAPVNTNKVPGVCKHLMKTIIALQQSGIVTN